MNTKFENMTVDDLKKLRLDFFSKILPSTAVTLFLFLFALVHASFKNVFGLTFTILTILTIIIGTLTFLYLTRKHRIDLKEKKVIHETKIIEDCVYKVDYEPGSATVPVNLLSLLFFKLIFMRKMKELHIYYIVVDGERIYLEKEVFDETEKGKQIIFRKAKHSGILLGVET